MNGTHTAKLRQSASVFNKRNGSAYRVLPAFKVRRTEVQLSQLVQICNQPDIYEILFRHRFGGRPYANTDAAEFFAWANAGWEGQTHFVYLVTDADGIVCAALDIKSADRAMPEVGYRCSLEHRGLMTEAVGKLIQWARTAGIQSLYAIVRKDNAASINVLQRNNFKNVGDVVSDIPRYKFYLHLASSDQLQAV